MNKGVQEFGRACAWLLASAAVTGCASSQPVSRSTHSGAYIFAGAGGTLLNPDTINDTLEVEEDVGPSAHLGLGYQVNRLVAVELRVADLGAVEFSDGRELGYQALDASGLLIWRRDKASVFGRLGVGTFRNDGDFEIDLENPVHPVVGGGLAFHATPNIDLRLSVSAHIEDAVQANLGLVWRFGTQSTQAAPASRVVVKGNSDDGFTPVAPVDREVENEPIAILAAPRGSETEFGLVIDEKPIPTPQTAPEIVIPDVEVAPLARTGSGDGAVAPTPIGPVPEPNPAVVPDAIAVPESRTNSEELFVVDTLLPIRPLQFEQGVADLLDTSLQDVDSIVELMKANPELRVRVESHAAPIGNADLNMLLSRRRALTVIRLLTQRGVEATRLLPRAFGDTSPIGDAESISDNDRVEIRVR